MYRTRYAVVLVICLTILFTSLAYTAQAQQTGDKEYTQEQIDNIQAVVFLDRMAQPEPGYHQFAAMCTLNLRISWCISWLPQLKRRPWRPYGVMQTVMETISTPMLHAGV